MGEITRKHIPMLRYAFFLLIGIVLERYFQVPFLLAASMCLACLVFIIVRILKPSRTYQTELFISISLLMCCLGMLRMHTWEQKETCSAHKLRISSFPQKQSFQTQFEATEIHSSPFDFMDAETFLVICNDTGVNLVYGDVFCTSKASIPIEDPALPFEFNYKNYLFSNGIQHKIELCSVIKDSSHEVSNIFYHWIEASRKQFKKSTAQIFNTPESKGLAESLLLGYREELDKETKDSFLKSGVSHLLAVSGMHTALIYEALFLLFIPFGSSQKNRFAFLITALIVLCYFTLLSGCSTSVLRASIMCGLFATAYAFRKRGSGLNTLGSSMLLILWCSPYQVWNLGFQLSVLAVLGILTLHQYISKQIECSNKVATYFMEGLSITVCAQITTLPVVLYHFQSFPLYFIPANILLIPISTIGLFASMLSIFFVGLGISFPWLFIATQWIIELFANCAHVFSTLPHSNIQPISFTALEACLVSCIVVVYIQQPFIVKKKPLVIGLLLCFCWSSYRIYYEVLQERKTETVFIRNGKRSALLSIKGLNASLYTQIPSKSADVARIKAYYNLSAIQEYTSNPQSSGLMASISGNNLLWITKKNCTPINVPINAVYSFKETDSIKYQAQNFHSLKVKSVSHIK
jgi:competence protein ComEC